MQLHHHWITAFTATLLYGCGGAGNEPPPAVQTLYGTFLDAKVQGLQYKTATQQGDTDAAGRFAYLAGESVTFAIGNMRFTSVTGQPFVTPLDIAGITNPSDQRVINMLVLLQSLDADGATSNGIQIPPLAQSVAPVNISFDVAPEVFRANPIVSAFVHAATTANRGLVSDATALAHFQQTLNTTVDGGKLNITPFAIAGADQTLMAGTRVQLDGSASGDANGDTLTYQWQIVNKPNGSAIQLTNSNSASASFTPDLPGIYQLGLVVSDGALRSPMATMQVSVQAQSGVPTGYALVWADEFNSSTTQLPDASKWAYDVHRNSVGWYNNELQYYSAGRLQNSSVQNGSLRITARKENLAGSVSDWGGQAYTSARLFTKGKASWTYGYFDIRAKLPCGTGTWPAIWSLGSTIDTWPDQGEIDIMEQTGWDKGRTLATVHTRAGYGGNGSTGSTAVADACVAFHNYQMLWTPQSINFYVDGIPFRSAYNNPGTASGWPFDKPQYLLLNVAVGGVLGGAVNDATLSATGMEVDYVRVYQKR